MTYSGKHRNMNENSNGSVTPLTKAHTTDEIRMPFAAFLLSEVRYRAAAAPAIPNMVGAKKPDMYMPRLQPTSAEVFPAQNAVRSPIPMVSNQKTLFSA